MSYFSRDQVHNKRTIFISEGQKAVERLESRNDAARTYSYGGVIEWPQLKGEYGATLSVEADTDGSVVRWSVQFEGKDDMLEEGAKRTIAGVFEAGIRSLQKRIG